MKVFISWSGERSQILGQALYEWIPMVLQSVSPWLSKADIEAGERWGDKIAKELEDCNFGILCVTRENISSPWILFEAGALAKLMQEGRVIPLLLDIEFKDVAGPLAQFQAKKVERDGILDVITSINNISDTKLTEALLPKQFSVLWPQLEEQIGKIPKTASATKQHRPQQEILEELVLNIRGLDVRLRETVDINPEARKRRRSFHPAIFRDMVHFSEMMGSPPHDPLRILIAASLLKEDLPWFYELALDAYRQTVNRTPRAKAARKRMFSAVKMLRRGPWFEMIDSKELYIMFMELERYFHEFEMMDSDLNQDQSGESLGDILGKAFLDKREQENWPTNTMPDSDNSRK